MKISSQLSNLVLVCVLVVLAVEIWRPGAPVNAAAAPPAAALPAAAQPAAEGCDSSRSIQVSGTAVIYVTPDQASLQLGVQSTGNTPDQTREANVKAIQNVIKAIQKLGVDPKDIATNYYIVYPIYDDYNSLFIKGYRIDNTVSIMLKDVNLADDVIITALKVGANEVQDVQFYTSELRKYRDQARDMAVKAAGEKGAALAKAAGAQTGCVLSINENSWSYYYGSWQGGRTAAMWAQNVAQNIPQTSSSQMPDDSPVSLGQIAVQAQVNTSYALQ